MTLLDNAIVIFYLIVVTYVGLLTAKKASEGIDSYFLGNRKLPWWALAASGMASNLDITGTMIIAALVYSLGVNGFFIEIRGGVTLVMALLMIFMGKWNTRSGAMTLAEWMKLRFGNGRQGEVARLVAAISSIIMTIAMITYFAIGGGKFLDTLLGIKDYFGLPSEFWAAFLLIFFSMIYTVASGLHGVVWTDVYQGGFIFLAIAVVAYLAWQVDLPETFSVSLPMNDGSFRSIETTRQAWTDLIPNLHMNLPTDSQYAIYNLFGVAVSFYLMKVILEGLGGTGNYMLQRYFAAKDDREAGFLSVLWIFLLSFRWVFIGAIAVLGVSHGSKIVDPELVLPNVIEALPMGLKGTLVAGLMAAGMSTFDSTVNAGAAYWVKDIYLVHINPNASNRQAMLQSYFSSIWIVVLGLATMLLFKNINDIWGWITMSIGSGLLIPMLLRWYWPRMNGWGFSIGTLTGMTSAIIFKAIAPQGVTEYNMFIVSNIFSLLGTIAGTLLTEPVDEETLQKFYNKTLPFGGWGRFKKCLHPDIIKTTTVEHRRDIFASFLAIPWQIVFFLFMMTLLFKSVKITLILGSIGLILSIILYYSWFRHLTKKV